MSLLAGGPVVGPPPVGPPPVGGGVHPGRQTAIVCAVRSVPPGRDSVTASSGRRTCRPVGSMPLARRQPPMSNVTLSLLPTLGVASAAESCSGKSWLYGLLPDARTADSVGESPEKLLAPQPSSRLPTETGMP